MALKYKNLARPYVVLGSGHAVCAEETGPVQPASQPPRSQKEHLKSLELSKGLVSKGLLKAV